MSSQYKSFLEQFAPYRYRLELNSFIVARHRLFYLDTPKTAGTSIKRALASCVDPSYQDPVDSHSPEPTRAMYIHDRSQNPVPSLFTLAETEQEQVLFSESWTRFCVVRNPYDRLFSAWFSKVLLNETGYRGKLPGYVVRDKFSSLEQLYQSFGDFVEYLYEKREFSDPHWNVQYNLLMEPGIRWNRVIRYENLGAELTELFQSIGAEVPALERRNESGFHPDYSAMKPSTLERIYELYRDDFDHYGYGAHPPQTRAGDSGELFVYLNGVAGRNERIALLLANREQDEQEIERLVKERDLYQKSYDFPLMVMLRAVKRVIRRAAKLLSRAR